MADAELLVVCIDNSYGAYQTISDQYAAVKHYCKTKLAANRETEVMVFTMGSSDFRCVLFPATSNYKVIKRSLKSICIGAGYLCLRDAISFASPVFCAGLGNKKKRMLFLVGGLVDMSHKNAEQYGSRLKDSDIAVDVVNFYQGGRPRTTSINQYGKMELDEFVSAAKSEDNSHIEHVQPGSNIRKVLSEFILKRALHDSMIKTDHREKAKRKKHSRHSRKTKHHKRSKGKKHADGDNEHVQTEALSIS